MSISPQDYAALQARVAGPPRPRKQPKVRGCASEDEEQAAVIAWACLYQGTYPDLALLCHYPSGGSRHMLEAVKLKKMGVQAGIPDLFLCVARGGFFGLWIELKAIDGKVSPGQEKMMIALAKRGYFVRVCYGAEAAIRALTGYLQMPLTKRTPTKNAPLAEGPSFLMRVRYAGKMKPRVIVEGEEKAPADGGEV